jgi:hypothetical protein
VVQAPRGVVDADLQVHTSQPAPPSVIQYFLQNCRADALVSPWQDYFESEQVQRACGPLGDCHTDSANNLAIFDSG